MGYRSEVVLAIKKEVLTKALIASQTIPTSFSDKTLWDAIEERGDSIYYVVNQVKWYQGYAEIDAVTAFIRWIEDTLSDEDFGFIRLGEETDDNELLGNPWEFGFGVSREIYLPF